MKAYYLIALVASLFGLGCGTYVNTTELNSPPHSMVPRPADAVEVYSSAPPTRAHVDVALMEANQDDWDNDTANMVQKLRERAGERGCDAVFISGRSDASPGGSALTASHLLMATCIVYLPEPTQHNAASASQEGVAEDRAPPDAPPKDGGTKR